MNKSRIFILGIGSVGKNLLNLMQTDSFYNNFSNRFTIVGAADSKHIIETNKGVRASDILQSKSDGNLSKIGIELDTIPDPDSVDILVDMSSASKDGKREAQIYKEYLKEGKSVVTANKSPLANFWPEIMEWKREGGGEIRFEATVCGGLPLFNMIKSSLSELKMIYFNGLVNLTSNYVLESMRSGGSIDNAINDAIRDGFAEADYSDDLSGLDSARKTVIVSNALFHTKLRLKDLKYEGIKPDIEFQHGIRTMLLSSIKEENGKVISESMLEQIGPQSKFFGLGPKAMAYELKASGRASIFVSEDFDGPIETSMGVFSDILSLKH
ncbi:MAG: hypothetical protein ACYDAO_04550 [Thermoplasmataceae archaeon]